MTASFYDDGRLAYAVLSPWLRRSLRRVYRCARVAGRSRTRARNDVLTLMFAIDRDYVQAAAVRGGAR